MIVIMRWKRSLVHTYIVASGCLVNRCPSNAWACWDTFLHCALLSYAEHASDLSSNGSMETALGEYKSLQRFFLRIATLTIFSIDLSNSIKDRLKPHPCLEVLVLITSLKKSSRNWGSLLIFVYSRGALTKQYHPITAGYPSGRAQGIFYLFFLGFFFFFDLKINLNADPQSVLTTHHHIAGLLMRRFAQTAGKAYIIILCPFYRSTSWGYKKSGSVTQGPSSKKKTKKKKPTQKLINAASKIWR